MQAQVQERKAAILASDLIVEGEHKYIAKDFKRALKEFKAADALTPNNIDIVFNLGLTYFSLGRYTDALKSFAFCVQKARREEGNEFLACRVLTCLITRDFPGAILKPKDFPRAGDGNFLPPDLECYMGFAYLFVKQFSKAEDSFSEITTDDRYGRLAKLGNSLIQMFEPGDLLREVGDVVIDCPPDEVEVLFLLKGIGFSVFGQANLAQAAFDELLRKSPSFGPAYYQKGLSYLEQNFFMSAFVAYKEALKRDPENAVLEKECSQVLDAIKKNLQRLKTQKPAEEKKVTSSGPAIPVYSMEIFLRDIHEVSVAEVVDGQKNNLLHMAVMLDLPREVLAEFAKSISPDAVNSDGQTPLYIAVKLGRKDAIQYLLKRTGPKRYGAEGTILEVALRYHHSLEILGELLDTLPVRDLNQPLPDDGRPVLQIAAAVGNAAAIPYLVKRDAKVNLADEKKRTALEMAALHRHDFAVGQLIACGADFDDQSDAGKHLLASVSAAPVPETARLIEQKKKDRVLTQLGQCGIEHRARQKTKRENVQGVGVIIYLALFAELNQANPQRDFTILKQLVAFVLELPECQTQTQTIAERLHLPTQALEKARQAPKGSQFLAFVNHRMVAKIPELSVPQKWHEAIERGRQKEEKKNEFKENLQMVIGDYVTFEEENLVVLDNLAFQLTRSILANEKLTAERKKFKISEEDLRKWFMAEFKEHAFYELLKHPEKKSVAGEILFKHGLELVTETREQFSYALGETKIRDCEKIFKQRAKIALGIWLNKFARLDDDQEQRAFVIANLLVKDLELKDKQVAPIRQFIKEVLLDNRTLLSYLGQFPEEQKDFVTRVREPIGELATKHLTTDTQIQGQYRAQLREHVHAWFEPRLKKIERDRAVVSMANEKRKYFIRVFTTVFDDCFAMFNALDKDLVRRAVETIDKFKDAVEENKDKFPKFSIFGIQADLGFLASMAASIGVTLKDHQVAIAAQRMMHLFFDYLPTERTLIIQEAACRIADRFRIQIMHCEVGEGMQNLARCAADRTVNFIVDADESSIQHKYGLFKRFLNSIRTFISGGPSLKPDLRDADSVLIEGVLKYGATSEHNKKLIRIDGHLFQVQEVLENCVIVTRDAAGRLCRFRHENSKELLGDCYGDENYADLEGRGFKNIGPAMEPPPWDQETKEFKDAKQTQLPALASPTPQR